MAAPVPLAVGDLVGLGAEGEAADGAAVEPEERYEHARVEADGGGEGAAIPEDAACRGEADLRVELVALGDGEVARDGGERVSRAGGGDRGIGDGDERRRLRVRWKGVRGRGHGRRSAPHQNPRCVGSGELQ